MKIDNQDIIRTAQQLRDEENEQLDIRPWNRHRSHFRIPSWLVAIPAAVFIGFILGIWTKSSNQQDTPLTALIDTVYVKVPVPQPQQKNISQAIPTVLTKPIEKETSYSKKVQPRRQAITSRPLAEDGIRYDLLERN